MGWFFKKSLIDLQNATDGNHNGLIYNIQKRTDWPSKHDQWTPKTYYG